MDRPVFVDQVVKATHRHPKSYDEFIAAQNQHPRDVWFNGRDGWINDPTLILGLPYFLGPVTNVGLDYYAIPIDFEYNPPLKEGDRVRHKDKPFLMERTLISATPDKYGFVPMMRDDGAYVLSDLDRLERI